MFSQFPQFIGALYPKPPYRFELLLNILGRYTHPIMEFVYDGAYWRTVHHQSGLVMVRVVAVGTSDAPQLHIFALSASVAINAELLLLQIGHILAVDLDYTPFYDFAKTQPDLWELVAPLQGLRWLRTQSVFEALMHTIIEQQIAWVAAQKAQRWLVEWGGNMLDYAGLRAYAFPSPKQIANATLDELTPLKITFKRMQVMIDIAQAIMDETLPIESVLEMPATEAYNFLVAIKGIGHWTASWTLQRTLGIHPVVGHNDVALQAAVGRYFFGIAGKVPVQTVIDTFGRYGEHGGLAANLILMRWILDRY